MNKGFIILQKPEDLFTFRIIPGWGFRLFFSRKSLLNQITRQEFSVRTFFYRVFLTSGQEAHPL